MNGRRWHGWRIAWAFVVLLVGGPLAHSQDEAPTDEATSATGPTSPTKDVFEEFAEGTRLLLENRPNEALAAYGRAKTLEPDLPEIDFVTGLAQYAKGDYEQARTLFQRVTTSADDDLAADAAYEIGATHHMEALDSAQDPKQAIASLESAMQQYQQVLQMDPQHEATRDANRKAASMWRQLQQAMQEQQQQNDSCDNEKEQDDNDKKDERQNKDDKQNANKDQDDQQQQQDQQESEDQKQQQNQQQSEDEKQQQGEQQEGDEEQQQQQAQEEKERVSREQAQRRLREMMQALREREKRRAKPVQVVPVAPVDKDW